MPFLPFMILSVAPAVPSPTQPHVSSLRTPHILIPIRKNRRARLFSSHVARTLSHCLCDLLCLQIMAARCHAALFSALNMIYRPGMSLSVSAYVSHLLLELLYDVSNKITESHKVLSVDARHRMYIRYVADPPALRTIQEVSEFVVFVAAVILTSEAETMQCNPKPS
jgi:hypothetical protein